MIIGFKISIYPKMKHKALDKTLEQCFLKKFNGRCKTSGESQRKQQKAI